MTKAKARQNSGCSSFSAQGTLNRKRQFLSIVLMTVRIAYLTMSRNVLLTWLFTSVMKWKPKTQTATQAAAYKGKGKAKPQSAQAIAAAKQAATRASEERKARLSSLTEELEARNERLALLQRTFREMQVQRAVMGKGSKNVVGTKTQGLSREDARLNQDDLDELELKRALNQKVKLPEPGIGLATGARVWKWKAERRR